MSLAIEPRTCPPLHPRVKDLTGQVFGRLTVVAFIGTVKSGRNRCALWACDCSCGRGKPVVKRGYSLIYGYCRSCGCLQKETGGQLASKFLIRHGHARARATSRLYRTWCGLKNRCLNPNDHKYPNYGGRGITVCDQWLHGDGTLSGFQCFLADMPPHPGKGYTIERLNVNGRYEPGNCVWATATQQARNRRTNALYTFAGETKCIAEWAEQYGIDQAIVGKRLRKGVPIEIALTAPPQPRIPLARAA